MVQKLGGAILGMKWDIEANKLSVALTVNVSKRRRGETTGPDVTDMCIEDIEASVITRKLSLSITMSIYEPLGYICPLTIRLKWLLQQLLKPGQSLEEK
jgi:hypothetical protein